MLDINLGLLVGTIIVFLTLIGLLNSWLYNPLFSYMQKRDDDIKRDLSEVGSNDNEITALHEEAAKIIMDAKLEASALREKVIADAKELAESKIEAKRAENASEFDKFKESLVKERKALESSLLSQVPLFKEAVKAKISQI